MSKIGSWFVFFLRLKPLPLSPTATKKQTLKKRISKNKTKQIRPLEKAPPPFPPSPIWVVGVWVVWAVSSRPCPWEPLSCNKHNQVDYLSRGLFVFDLWNQIVYDLWSLRFDFFLKVEKGLISPSFSMCIGHCVDLNLRVEGRESMPLPSSPHIALFHFLPLRHNTNTKHEQNRVNVNVNRMKL